MLSVTRDLCNGCGKCATVCASEAIRVVGGKAVIDAEECTMCQACVHVCPVGAIAVVGLPVPSAPASRRPAIAPPVPAAVPTLRRVAPWVGAALAFVGREIAPRLADTFIAALERRMIPPNAQSTVNQSPLSPQRDGGRGARRRRRRNARR